MQLHVAVIGAGIAGMTTAHELARRGYKVSVYECTHEAGGFFRSARLPQHEGMPSEYSWHGFGPWYRNTFEILRQIPVGAETTAYDKLSKPVHFGMVYDDGTFQFGHPRRMFRMGWRETLGWAWTLLTLWTSDRRSQEEYSRVWAAHAFGKTMGRGRAWMAWRSCFGPWVGSDYENVSAHHVGQFFRRNIFSGPSHAHDGWDHGSGDGWLVLTEPSSEAWFEPWVKDLSGRGVEFHFGQRLERLRFEGDDVTSVTVVDELQQETKVLADFYVLATTPYAVLESLARSRWAGSRAAFALYNLRQKFDDLCTGTMHQGAMAKRRASRWESGVDLIKSFPGHIQISFRIAFDRKISWHGPEAPKAVVLADSKLNLTLFAQDQVFGPEMLGDGVQSLWTGTACCCSEFVGSRASFEESVIDAIISCKGLMAILQGVSAIELRQHMIRFEVWHEWAFDDREQRVSTKMKKYVNTIGTQRATPDQLTEVDNLVFAGAHTRTDADVWSIEGAVESGKRAASLIVDRYPKRSRNDSDLLPLEPVRIHRQHRPLLLRAIWLVDNLLFRFGLPQFMVVTLMLGITTMIGLALAWGLVG